VEGEGVFIPAFAVIFPFSEEILAVNQVFPKNVWPACVDGTAIKISPYKWLVFVDSPVVSSCLLALRL
jgi:hypothetical protein